MRIMEEGIEMEDSTKQKRYGLRKNMKQKLRIITNLVLKIVTGTIVLF